MKLILLLMTASFISLGSIGQSTQNEELVKKVVIAFQEDFNDGGFKNATSYTTIDWEHLDPGEALPKDVIKF